MPSKFRKAIGAVKDQTSISIAKVSKVHPQVLILKATRHDNAPIEDRYVTELLTQISSNKVYAAASAHVLAKRIGKTHNWIVALKSLILVFRIFQDGDPYFPSEVFHLMKRGAKILNLTTFRDDSNSCPWDYTAFVRAFALYLDERLDCFITGKLTARFLNRKKESKNSQIGRNNVISDTKPAMLLDKIISWQRLLDRAIATRPTGVVQTNKLVLISLYAVVQESFDLYRDISEGLGLLLDSFFHLPYQSCANAFQICVKASKQFHDLASFYDLCKTIGIGRTSEYPSVQNISEELLETLHEFLKDQSSFPVRKNMSPPSLPLPAQLFEDPSPSSDRYDQASEKAYLFSCKESENGSQCPKQEDNTSIVDVGISPFLIDNFLDQSQADDLDSGGDSASDQSFSFEQGTLSRTNSGTDLVLLDDWPREDTQNPFLQEATEIPKIATTTKQNQAGFPVNDMFSVNPTFQVTFSTKSPNHAVASPTFHASPVFTVQNPDQAAVSPTFRATPTFSAQSPHQAAASPTFSAQDPDQATASQFEDDPFAPYPETAANVHEYNGAIDQNSLLQQQQLWLQNQDRIIGNHFS